MGSYPLPDWPLVQAALHNPFYMGYYAFLYIDMLVLLHEICLEDFAYPLTFTPSGYVTVLP